MKRSFLFLTLSALVLTTALLFFQGVSAGFAAPGSADDPLVTKSYVDKALAALGLQGGGAGYALVNVSQGQTVTFGASTEVILRAGKAVAVTGQSGLSDVTDGRDIVNGGKIPANHLLIVPRADGRGLKAETNLVLMVKGAYEIQ